MRIRIRPYIGYGIDSILSIPMVQRVTRGCVKEITMYNHVERVQYRQASSRIKGRRRLIHTIKRIFWVWLVSTF
ncbi:hypothetical protein F383_00856 [Gossypium arboreum]|uniref:Uncharacterized protein n=1 Tax=Gossypium arboreum TaxID=29729 RepID=A0A0B0NKH1_GOSAR|nr:hypothetical protein F383_00856 [Gossypium arboreum]